MVTALEVKEAILTLQGKGPKEKIWKNCVWHLDVRWYSLLAEADSLEHAEEKLKKVIQNGKALEKFKDFLANQGGDASVVDHPDRLPQAQYLVEVPAEKTGYVAGIVADEISELQRMLSAQAVQQKSPDRSRGWSDAEQKSG